MIFHNFDATSEIGQEILAGDLGQTCPLIPEAQCPTPEALAAYRRERLRQYGADWNVDDVVVGMEPAGTSSENGVPKFRVVRVVGRLTGPAQDPVFVPEDCP